MQKTFKLLIVDDDKISLALMREILVKADPRYEILTCCDSAEALRRCTDGPVFDLVLLDVMMPVMDGYALCARLKDLPAYLDVPVIFITGLSKINEKLEAFKAGAVDYLVKPVETEEMKIRVKTHLRIKEY
ncbi:MAG: response regulator, partial [Candidatus Omnitrophota bacterium]